MFRSVACTVPLVFACFAHAAPIGRTKTLTQAQIKGFQIWESGPSGLSRSKILGNVRRSFYVRFKNETREEISEVDVRLRVSEDGRTTYLSSTFPLTRFDNTGLPHQGSLLPFNKSSYNTFHVDYPGRLWNTGSRDDVEVVAIKTYVGAQDLHDTGHLFTFIANSPDKVVVQRFTSDPSLLKVHDEQNMGAMALVCAVGGPEVVRYVLAHGGDLHTLSRGGSGLAHAAAFNTNLGVFDLLKAKGIATDLSSKAGRTPLVKAIQVGNPLAARWLLAHGANPNHIDKDDRTPMYYAITEGQTQILEALVRAGADSHSHNRNGWGWMHTAAVHNHLVLPWILRAGVSVNDTDSQFGLTPLMAVAENGAHDAIPWLLSHGANLDAKDKHGLTAYDYARRANTLQTDRFFREAVTKASH